MKATDAWILDAANAAPVSTPSTPPNAVPAILIALNVVGILLTYATTIILARWLSPNDFEQFIGAIVTVGLLTSIAEGGFGKYALRILPTYAARDRPLLRGYMRFAMLGVLGWSFVLAFAAAAAEISYRSGGSLRTTLFAIACLPVFAIAGVVVDLLMALSLPTIAMFLSRVGLPLTTLVLIGGSAQLWTMTPGLAVACFMLSSLACGLCGWVISLIHLRRLASPEPLEYQCRSWMRGGLTYWWFHILISWLFRSSLFIVHHVPHQANPLADLAPAFETGCLVLLLSKSTDKYYQPALAVAMDSRDWERIALLRRSRFLLLGFGVMAFNILIFCFGDHILELYGSQYTTSYAELCLISLGSSMWTMFSLAPTVLLFTDQRRSLLSSLVVHALLMFLLTSWLFVGYGALGVACAYTIAISSFSICNFILANQHLARLRALQ